MEEIKPLQFTPEERKRIEESNKLIGNLRNNIFTAVGLPAEAFGKKLTTESIVQSSEIINNHYCYVGK